ncbi:MAG: endonuclease, partial [Prevotella sp.]|nr:endonuclease [Prevotella sp.]
MRPLKSLFYSLAAVAFFAGNAFAAIPDGYYDAADGLSGTALKAALQEIISVHKTLSYDNLWEYYPYTYYYTGDENRVYDMYSDVVTYFDDYSGMDKEHVVPKSWWGSSTASGPGCDLYNVIPGESKANNAKSNNPLGIVSGTPSFDNGRVRVGASGVDGYDGKVFEPADADKGDFARIYLYVATCYPEMDWDTNNADAMTDASELTLQDWIVSMLLDWNTSDAVDDAEIQRNEDVSKYQENRNPFIDYPELADYIWGSKSGEKFYFADHTANEGSSNDNMKTRKPTFSVDYGTSDAPKNVVEGTVVTVKGGDTYAVLHTRVNGGDWTETSYTTGYNSSSGSTYGINAAIAITVNGETTIEAYCSRDGYADSETITAYFKGMDMSEMYLLYEAFDDVSTGNNTDANSSSTAWAGNDNFPEVSTVYCAGNALRMGKSKTGGSITSRELDTEGGEINVELDVKGWTTVESDLLVELTGADAQTVEYTATMTDSFEHAALVFSNVSPQPVLTIS